jgi:phosphatidylglycerol lysyltransferase
MTNADSMAALGLCDDRAVAAVSLLQRRRRQRRISMLVVVVVGVANLAGALYPRLEPHAVRFGKDAPVLVGNGQRLFTIAAGVGLIVLALGLRSAQRRAWTAAVIISALSVLAHISRGLPLVSTALAVALLAWLVATRRAYPASSRPTERRAVLGFVLLSALLVAYGLIEWERHEPGLPHQSLSGRLTVIARGMLFLDPGVQGTTRAARAYLGSLQFAGSLLAAALALVVLRPVLSWRQRHGADSLHRFVQRFGRTSTAPLIELPDNRVLELHDGNTIVGCKIHAGVVISVGDPIARPETAGDALGDFIRWSSDTGRVPVMLGASSALAARAAELGLEADKIGEDARIVLADFSLAGKARANVRHSVTRAEKDAVTARAYTSHDRDRHVDAQLRAISEAWLATKRGPELGFTLGRFDVSRLDRQEVWIATVGDRVVAFVTWLPFDDGAAAVLDLMRRSPDAPPGTMELLITRSMEAFRAAGRREVSLGGIPLASATDRTGRIEQAAGWLFEHSGAVYDAKGLFSFKKKFAPDWEPLYLIYPTRTDLPRVAFAIGQAFLPPGWGGLFETVRTLRS